MCASVCILNWLVKLVGYIYIPHSVESTVNAILTHYFVIHSAAPDEYKHYTQLLRHEYANLDDETYKMMRVKVLETLLLIPCIYATPEYREKYEELARTNIRNEISELKN